MIVATWNIGSLYADYSQHIQTMQSWIETAKIDLLCLQELPDIHSLQKQISQWGHFNSVYFFPCSPSHVCIGHHMGVGLFCKEILKPVDYFFLPKPLTQVFCKGHEETLHDKFFLAAGKF